MQTAHGTVRKMHNSTTGCYYVCLQDTPHDLEACLCRYDPRCVFLIIGNHDRLHIHVAIAVGKCFPLFFIRLLLIVHLDVALAVVNEDAYLTDIHPVTLLHPDDLSVVVDWLHAVTGNSDTEVRTVRYR